MAMHLWFPGSRENRLFFSVISIDFISVPGYFLLIYISAPILNAVLKFSVLVLFPNRLRSGPSIWKSGAVVNQNLMIHIRASFESL